VSTLIVDLETTSLSPTTGGVVEIGACLIADGAVAATWESLCWPGYDRISQPCHWGVLAKCSGISPALLLDAPEVGVALSHLAVWATKEMGSGAPVHVTSYNVAFDRPFIEAAPWYPMWWKWSDCLMLRAQRHLGLTRWPSLDRACQLLGVEREGSHRALADARAAAGVLLALEATAP
jgi:DNA polymerase III epsilon subunit-like protein